MSQEEWEERTDDDEDFEEDELLDDEYEDEDDDEEDLEQEQSAAEPEPLEQTVPASSGPATVPDDARQMLAVDDVELSLSVELGRIKMSLGELSSLSEGNVLELDALPENAVDLLVQGQKMARCELVQVGNVLGVRILELA